MENLFLSFLYIFRVHQTELFSKVLKLSLKILQQSKEEKKIYSLEMCEITVI